MAEQEAEQVEEPVELVARVAGIDVAKDSGMRRSFVPPQDIRDLRALTRLRAMLTAECSRHKQRVEKILEDALIKVSAVVSELFGKSGRAMLRALVAGQRDPTALAELAQGRLKVKKAQLAEALTGRFRDVHAVEVGMLIDLIDTLEAKTAALTEKITAHLASLPGVPAACTSCGMIGEHTGDCANRSIQLPSLVARLDEIPGIGPHTAHVLLAELGLGMSQFPTAAHAAAWAKLSPRPASPGPPPGRARPARATGGCAAPSATPRWPSARPTPSSANATGASAAEGRCI
jgi:transposase